MLYWAAEEAMEVFSVGAGSDVLAKAERRRAKERPKRTLAPHLPAVDITSEAISSECRGSEEHRAGSSW